MSLETDHSAAAAEKKQTPPRFLQTHHQRAILRHMIAGGSLASLLNDEGFQTSFQPHEIELFWRVTQQMEEHADQGGNIPSFLAGYYERYIGESVRRTLATHLDDPETVDMGIDEVIDEAQIHVYENLERMASGDLAIDVKTTKLAPYLGTMGANFARDRIRRTNLKHARMESLEERMEEPDEDGRPTRRTLISGASPSAEHEALFNLFVEDIRAALGGDEIKLQMIIQSALANGIDIDDLAQVTGIPRGRIKMQKTRAFDTVERRLKPTWEDGIE